MDLAGRYLVVWLSPEAIETFLGVLGSRAVPPRRSPGRPVSDR
jgi:hypothetical protein